MENSSVWAPVLVYEGFYEVSDEGEVRSLTRQLSYGRHGHTIYRGRTLKPCFFGKYLGVGLSLRGVVRKAYVHETVLRAFVGPRPVTESRGEIRHLDGQKTNNCLSNLAYGTIQENVADRMKHKQMKAGK